MENLTPNLDVNLEHYRTSVTFVALDDENVQTISQSSSSAQQNCKAVIRSQWRH